MRLRAIALAVAVTGLTAVSPALADDPLPVRPPTPLNLAPAPAGVGLWTKVGLLVMAAGAGVWIYKRRKSAPVKTLRTIEISARKAIGVRSELLVVEVEGQTLLLGVTASSIQRLATLVDSDTAKLADLGPSEAEDDEREPAPPPPRRAAPAPAPAPEPEPRSRPRQRPRALPSPAASSPVSAPAARRSTAVEEQIRGLLRGASSK